MASNACHIFKDLGIMINRCIFSNLIKHNYIYYRDEDNLVRVPK